MHHGRKRDSGKCQEVQDSYIRDNAGSREICVEERDALKKSCKKSNMPDVIVIEDDDGDGEVENYDNEAVLRNRHGHLSSCSGLDNSKSSLNAYELSTSSDEEDCIVIEPRVSIRSSFVNHRLPRARKRRRPSAETEHQLSERISSPSDLSECEIVSNFNGSVKQNWEEAALRRRTEKSRRAESEESTSASVHTNSEARKSSRRYGRTMPTPIKSTKGQTSRADPSSYAKRRKEDAALDQQGSSVNLCHEGSKASTRQTLLAENKVTSVVQCSNDSKSLTSGESGGCEIASEDKVLADREALKQTQEFRHAEEEEWARRHLELQKQAEKAQREKKKRKLEADRQIEMEARQKRRLEEIRQSQLKEEQASGFKEQIRDRVQSELDYIGKSCRDMATLLRKLGVPVEGGAFATEAQVTAAYKKALLCFHPDRAAALAKSDPASHVEAEEKFKLVSRMKSILPLVSSGFY